MEPSSRQPHLSNRESKTGPGLSNSAEEQRFQRASVVTEGSGNAEEETTRTRLLNAAGEIFAESGYEAATVRDICDRAGANVASVNYYFKGKQGLYEEVIKFAQKFRADQSPLPEWPEGTLPETKLADFIRTMVFRMLVAEELPWQGRIMMREMLEPTGACRGLTEDYIRPHHKMLTDIIAEMAPPGLPKHRLDQLAFSLIGQCMYYKLCDPICRMLLPEDEMAKYYSPEQLTEHITSVMLAALGRGSLEGKREKGKGER